MDGVDIGVDQGQLYFDTTNKVIYLNTGTEAAPEWHGLMLS